MKKLLMIIGAAYLLGAGVMMISFFRTFAHDRIEEWQSGNGKAFCAK